MASDTRISIAILGLGGQGGGVLADWIVQLGEAAGFVTQGTSVPGVAQRTGSTVYYIEWMRAGDRRPVLALMPVPGDVDIVIASELMEAGRAMLRGFVSDRTTLIASTHRVYAIAEKSAPGDGRASDERILAAARERSARFIGFDMDAAAIAAGSVISSTLFGALAASEALPVPRSAFEDAIRAGGKAVEASLRAFAAGHDAARSAPAALPDARPVLVPPVPTTVAGRRIADRIVAHLPAPAHPFALEGARRLMDYQDDGYARLYLDRLEALAALDPDGLLTAEAARHLALWMAYEDTIRVAGLKVRESRTARVRAEVRAQPGQILGLVEYMHPRFEEICETLPAGIGARLLAGERWRRLLAPRFEKGRHVETSGIRWFTAMRLLSAMRRFRRGTLKYRVEQARIEDWLARITTAARSDPALALELVRCQRLIKGYGDTHVRGWDKFTRLMAAAENMAGRSDAGARLAMLREAALADESGSALDAELARLAA
ncbi:indolepyruvate oxidoreductase subunit beta family protein [Sphingomonas baiyangensis]|uniref:Indolepyruvate oxidoreductase subunit beta family protein n=1 Tax=Sphingomonas baiyangensis TaxID=2572576 RepID=A0A4U1L2K9_9SPHN|nr:indolepyruvate oxidoreductase subunit beta family protein [Sphingomonas baiyangensis]TKD51089.1 indolepyruvate oxidoreductase subunit beta family protein [Sphingomonas baiyangensis]